MRVLDYPYLANGSRMDRRQLMVAYSRRSARCHILCLLMMCHLSLNEVYALLRLGVGCVCLPEDFSAFHLYLTA